MRLIDADALKEKLKGTLRYFDIVADIDAAPTIKQEQRWIPCGERMPKKNDAYLVSLARKAHVERLGYEFDNVVVRKMLYYDGRWDYSTYSPEWLNDVLEEKVIAWKPLPKPYKEDKE